MKLRFDQVSQNLKNGLAPIYIVSGDVPLLVQECCDQIKHSAKVAGFSEYQRFHIDKQFNWNELYQSTQSLSLFGDKNLIELRMPNGKPNDTGKNFLKGYVKKSDGDNLIILVTSKLDAAVQRSAWFKAIENAGVLIQIWPIEIERLPQWIHQRMRQAGLEPNKAAIQLIAEKVEGNLLAASQEIEKLRLLNGEGPIDEKLVLAAITDSARYDIFQLVETAQLGNTAKAIKILHGLKDEGYETTLVLWAITRELRSLAGMAAKLATGSTIHQVFQEYRVWDKRKPAIQASLKRLSTKDIGQLIQKARNADLAIKGLEKNDPWLIFSDIILCLSGCSVSLHS
ncbi:MAG: DNA polymerase III subunit delta [Gammaproteobacteria bacterium]|nr:DNA polymerase III subunit delta [Gammaproteobacteria bacterium]